VTFPRRGVVPGDAQVFLVASQWGNVTDSFLGEHVIEHSDDIEIDPASFLIRICERLAAKVGTDRGVSAILTTLLTGGCGTAEDVVSAREALRQLAADRAAVGTSEEAST
jgi:hypothetical protein